MLRQILFLLMVFIATSAKPAFGADSWIGFKNTKDDAVPKLIQNSAKSVFRIFFPTASSEVVDLSNISAIDAIIKKYEGKDWEMIQLAYCRVQEILKCPVSSKDAMGGGSAFVFRDTKTLVTNLHNLRPWLSSVIANNNWKNDEARAKIHQLVVPFVLLDQDGNLVFSPALALKSGAYRTKLINDDLSLFDLQMNPRTLKFALSDYVELEFINEFKVQPLQPAESSETEKYYVVGYPGPTNIFAKLGGGEADGLNQMASVGTSTNLDTDLSGPPGNVELQRKYFTRINAPSYVGNSGGPVFNSEGRVVGVLAAGDLYREVDNKPAYYSEFINSLKLNELQKVWSHGSH